MNEKVTEIDLAKKLGTKANVSESVAADFIATYFSLIREGLEADGIVKITGLGTFKLILAESRKIVNVHTKEDQEIPSHYRITFSPDKELAGRLNEPFAHLSTVNLDEEDIREEPIAHAAREFFDDEIREIPLPIDAPVMHKEMESYVSETDPDENTQVQNLRSQIGDPVEPQVSSQEEVLNNKSSRALPVILLSCLFTLSVAAVLYFSFAMTESDNVPVFTDEEPMMAKAEDSETDLSKDSLIAELPVQEVVATEITAEVSSYDPIAEETIRYGSRLTLLAQRYYGNKHFWCYIFEENKSIIDNPNLIPVGTKISIPDPRKYQIDAASASSVEKAKQQASDINKRYM